MGDTAPGEVPVPADDAEALRGRIAILRAACAAALTTDELVAVAVTQAGTAAAQAGTAGVLFLIDGDELTVAAGSGFPRDLSARWSRCAVSAKTSAGDAVRERRAQWLAFPVEKAGSPDLAPEGIGYEALAALPVVSDGQVLGVLTIYFREARCFTSMERLFLLLLADEVGAALRRGLDLGGEPAAHRLRENPERRPAVRETLVLADPAKAFVDRSLALARTICDTHTAQLCLLREGLVVTAGSGSSPEAGSVVPAANSLCAVAMSSPAPFAVVDAGNDERVARLPAVRSGKVQAYLGVRVYASDVPAGVLCVSDAYPRGWSGLQQETLEVIASAVGAELTLREAASRERWDRRAAEIRSRLTARLMIADSMSESVTVVLEAVTAVNGVSGAALIASDRQTRVRHQGVRCADPNAAAALGVLADSALGHSGSLVRVLDLDDLIDVLLDKAAHLLDRGVRRAVEAPVKTRAVRGVLTVAVTDDADIARVRREVADLAQVAGVSLDRATVHERHLRATSQSAFLSTASAHMEASLDVDETLQRMARIAVPVLAEGCLVFLAVSGGLRLAAASHVNARVEERIRPELGVDPAISTLVESAVNGSVTSGDALPGWLQAARFSATPLRARGKLIGVIVLLESASDGKPRLLDEALMTNLAAHAAIVIDNAVLYAKRSADVSALQSRLLPPELPSLPDFDLAAYYEAGDRSLDVGGDYYDVIVGDDRLVLLIGDVCGHGAEAAAITGMARAVLRTVIQDGASPARALWRLNEAMRAAGDKGEFCTAAVVQIDGRGDDCHLRLAVGGHPLPLLNSRGETRKIGQHGPMLGLLAGPSFQEIHLPLRCDDVLLLYTDGVTEARRGIDFFGSRLTDAVNRAGKSAEKAIAHTVQAVEQFSDRRNDDIAALALRPRGRSLAWIEVPDLLDPSLHPQVSSLIRDSLPDHQAAGRALSRRVSTALSRLPQPMDGPCRIDMLRVPDGWRMEISRPLRHDRVNRPEAGAAAPRSGVPNSTGNRFHGFRILGSVEVRAGDE